jgi:hypothetical protein
MKFLKCFVILLIFVSGACSVSILGKVLNKFNELKSGNHPNEIKKDTKAPIINQNSLKNVSHGFVPHQIKCELSLSLHCFTCRPISLF